MLRSQASRSCRLLACGSASGPQPAQLQPSSSRGLASSSSSSSSDPPAPSSSRRSISAVAVQQQRVEQQAPLAYNDEICSGGYASRRLSWPSAAAPAAAAAAGTSGDERLESARRRTFKPREGKERADTELDDRAAALKRLDRMFPRKKPTAERVLPASTAGDEQPTPTPNARRRLRQGQLPSVGRKLAAAAAASPKPPEPAGPAERKHNLLPQQSQAMVNAILLPPPPLVASSDRPAARRTTPPPPVQGDVSLVPTFDGREEAQLRPTPDHPTAQTSAFAIHVEHSGLNGRPLVLFVSPAVQTLLAERYPSCDTSDQILDSKIPLESNRGAAVVAQAAGNDRVHLLVQALGSGLHPYLPTEAEVGLISPSTPAAAAVDGALARECAALLWKCLEEKAKTHEDWFWIARAELELHETICQSPRQFQVCRLEADIDYALASPASLAASQLFSRMQRTRSSAELEHSLPSLYGLVRSADPDGGLQAADAFVRAARHFKPAATTEGRRQFEAIFEAILDRLAADGEVGAEGFQRLIWVLESRASFAPSGEQLTAENRRSLNRMVVRLLHASQAAAPELMLDVCVRLTDNAVLAPRSGTIARLSLSLADIESMVELLRMKGLRERHVALLLDRLLCRLETLPAEADADDELKTTIANSLSAAVASGRLPALGPGSLALRFVRFLAENGQVVAAAESLLPFAQDGRELEPASVAVAVDVLFRLAKDWTAGAVTLCHRILEAIPVGRRPVGLFNALLRQANLSFPLRKDADAVTDQIEALLAAEPGLVPDLGTIEARLLAPPRSERLPLVEYTMAELVTHSDARAQTYAELWELTLAQGFSFRPTTWRLLLSAVGREAGYFRAREVIDWMRMHGVTPDMTIWNQVLANARRAQGRSGQAKIKVFRTSLRQLVREEQSFQPDMCVLPSAVPSQTCSLTFWLRHSSATPFSRLSACWSPATRATLPPVPCASFATLTPGRPTCPSTRPAGLRASPSPRRRPRQGPSTRRSQATRRSPSQSLPSASRPIRPSATLTSTSSPRTTSSGADSSIGPTALRSRRSTRPRRPLCVLASEIFWRADPLQRVVGAEDFRPHRMRLHFDWTRIRGRHAAKPAFPAQTLAKLSKGFRLASVSLEALGSGKMGGVPQAAARSARARGTGVTSSYTASCRRATWTPAKQQPNPRDRMTTLSCSVVSSAVACERRDCRPSASASLVDDTATLQRAATALG